MLWVIYPRLRGCRMQKRFFFHSPFAWSKTYIKKGHREQRCELQLSPNPVPSRWVTWQDTTNPLCGLFKIARAEVTLSMQHSRVKHSVVVVAPTPNFKESRQQKNLIGFHMHVDPIFPGKLLILLAHKERRLEGRYLSTRENQEKPLCNVRPEVYWQLCQSCSPWKLDWNEENEIMQNCMILWQNTQYVPTAV